ncbi:DNA endonuclease RBBP8 isoform X2 [Labrus bergylta]|uniref:DNA endonuclease RBBP8 isoform X2 n=1 Tax=Labrus bergylta TaxID=56723 RepID=UPI00331334E9
MSSPSLSSDIPRPADLFEELWSQLRETHHKALQELEVKVSRLKTERCLDAQKLEVFYNRNQQLKEQNKTLQDALGLLEDRLHSGECERCAAFKDNLKNIQEENLWLVETLQNERICLGDKNRKLEAEVEKLKSTHSEQQQASSPDQEEGIIPDSPVLPSSLPVANKLRKRRNVDKRKLVRYAEMPLPHTNSSIFNERNKDPGGAEVLVPNTCELDSSQTSNDVNEDVEVAETCALELVEKPLVKTETTRGQQSSWKPSWKFDVHLSPDSTTDRSPSLLPRLKRFSVDDSDHKAKRKKEGSEHEEKRGKQPQPELIKRSESPLSHPSIKKEPEDGSQLPNRTSGQRSNVSCVSPAFKKPLARGDTIKDVVADRKLKVEPMWSMDPALALSMYDSEGRGDEIEEEEEEEGGSAELADTDVTWISHSALQRRDGADSVSGLGEKANDSLDMMFDTTAYGEYRSFNTSRSGPSQPREDDGDEAAGGDKEEDDDDPDETCVSQMKGNKVNRPTFAHVAVIRKKDERRKLKGATCKECEVYYAHLPEDEKQKKLSSCSRHRFLYIPPCTPENFWEVGFPSTQTCIDRGYVHEEKKPEARTRRRQPFNALFSPKRRNHQDSDNSFSL